jgi:hypothetical protein
MPRCYSQRMLNPFHGIVNMVEIDGADAVCCDGETWTLFVHSDEEVAVLDDGSRQTIETPDIKFGVWSERDGLQRAPVRNPVDYGFVDHIGRYLLDVVREKAATIPFPLLDRYELWLLDSAFDLPVVLLASACSRSQISADVPLRWRVGMSAADHFHVTPSLVRALGGENPAERVGRIVNNAAGKRPRAQWFYRGEKGSGQAILGMNVEPSLHGRVLPPEAFPEQLLRSHWPDETEQALVRAYLDWQAPWLLMLQHLNDVTRERLEQAAGRRAMLFAESHTLFPKIMDHARIVAARVEASLRRAAGEERDGTPQGDALFPFFND